MSGLNFLGWEFDEFELEFVSDMGDEWVFGNYLLFVVGGGDKLFSD